MRPHHYHQHTISASSSSLDAAMRHPEHSGEHDATCQYLPALSVLRSMRPHHHQHTILASMTSLDDAMMHPRQSIAVIMMQHAIPASPTGVVVHPHHYHRHTLPASLMSLDAAMMHPEHSGEHDAVCNTCQPYRCCGLCVHTTTISIPYLLARRALMLP